MKRTQPSPRDGRSEDMERTPRDDPADDASHGREAEAPQDLPGAAWWDILWRTRRQLSADNLPIVAAGVAFYGFVAVVPAIAATLATYAFFADAGQMAAHLEALAHLVPAEAMPLLQQQIMRIVGNETAAGLSAILGVAIAIYGSARATKALIVGLNIAFNERERRSFVRLNLTALALTLGAVVGVIVVVTLVTALPPILAAIGLTPGSEVFLTFLRWPVLVALFLGALAVLYRYGPCREAPQWRWLTWGAGAASLLWIAGSILFSYYVSSFGNYEKTYGSLGAIVVFLLWLMLSAFAVLFGAELNAEMERQTERDTTTGKPLPRGERGAYAADTLGPARPKSKRRRKQEPVPEREEESERGPPSGARPSRRAQ